MLKLGYDPTSYAITFNDGLTIKITTTEDELIFEPDVKTYVARIMDAFFSGSHGLLILGNCALIVESFIVRRLDGEYSASWKGDIKPASFLEFQKELGRFVSMKAYW